MAFEIVELMIAAVEDPVSATDDRPAIAGHVVGDADARTPVVLVGRERSRGGQQRIRDLRFGSFS